MELIIFTNEKEEFKKQAANLLIQAFPHAYGDSAYEEIEKCLHEDRVVIAAVDGEILIGFVGAIPQYGMTGWELHPLVVDAKFRSQGIGTMLCSELEKVLHQKGGITIYLGSDDENSSTSLSNTDLFENTYEKICKIKNLKGHPFEFYQKIGYKIVGVIPDANGIGKPDIWMAKNISDISKELEMSKIIQ